ncbi:MAG: outer membrane protein assembly factor, partial [Sedimenticola sp.]|nr:outer membrane protein assembly factor [Sedimenticola sp.]
MFAAPLGAEQPTLLFSGIAGELEANLRAGLSLTSEPCNAPAWRVKRLFRRADAELDRAARALGYYRMELEKNLQFTPPCWQARFTIQPGEPARLETITIAFEGEAHEDPAFRKLIQTSPVKKGSQVHHGEYESLKGAIERLAAERGYFDGRFVRSELKVDPQQNQAAITLHYESGRRYRIGDMTLQQQTYDPALLERYIKIRAGDPYDATALSNTHRALADSGYFQSVA